MDDEILHGLGYQSDDRHAWVALVGSVTHHIGDVESVRILPIDGQLPGRCPDAFLDGCAFGLLCCLARSNEPAAADWRIEGALNPFGWRGGRRRACAEIGRLRQRSRDHQAPKRGHEQWSPEHLRLFSHNSSSAASRPPAPVPNQIRPLNAPPGYPYAGGSG